VLIFCQTVSAMDEFSALCDNNLDDAELQPVLDWLRTAGKLALATQRGIGYRIKPDATPVTETEENIERFFAQKIHEHFPGHTMLGEESGPDGASGSYTWAIDPIDGTRPYLWGLPTWGVSVGLLCSGHPVAGFCYLPALDEMYWSWNGGAFLNGRALPAHQPGDFHDPMRFICTPSNAHLRYGMDYPRLHAFGSTVMHLALLARGVAAGVLTRRVYLWDIAAFLTIFPALGIEMRCLSGLPLETSSLLDGSRTAEPLIAAPREWMEPLQAAIIPRDRSA